MEKKMKNIPIILMGCGGVGNQLLRHVVHCRTLHANKELTILFLPDELLAAKCVLVENGIKVEISSRCYQNPLVIQGAGAGNDTTAAGVLADIIDLQDQFPYTSTQK